MSDDDEGYILRWPSGLEVDEETGEILSLPPAGEGEVEALMARALRDAAQQEKAWGQARGSLSRWFVARLGPKGKGGYGDLEVAVRQRSTEHFDVARFRAWAKQSALIDDDQWAMLAMAARDFDKAHPWVAEVTAPFRSWKTSEYAQAAPRRKEAPVRVRRGDERA